MAASQTPYKLGTFSIAGCAPFGALVVNDKAIALGALEPLAAERGLALTGTGSVLALLEGWERNAPVLAALADAVESEAGALLVPVSALKIHAPVMPRQVFCTGANYHKHVVDLIVDSPDTLGGEDLTREERRARAVKMMDERAAHGTPYAFTKPVSAVTGPYDPIVLPAMAKKPDWELELAIVIGKSARHVPREKALGYVAGYTIANDVSSRDLIMRRDEGAKALGTDWLSSKSAPSYLPLGPYVVPAAFVGDPQKLQLTLKLNGDTMQNESTSDMIFDVARQIEYISSLVQLLPGDIVCTGSPAGNGTHYNRFLRPGDIVETAITGLGGQRNPVVAERISNTSSGE